jgi:hypothetical protein
MLFSPDTSVNLSLNRASKIFLERLLKATNVRAPGFLKLNCRRLKYHAKPLWRDKAISSKAAENCFKLLSWGEWVPFKWSILYFPLSSLPPTVIQIARRYLYSYLPLYNFKILILHFWSKNLYWNPKLELLLLLKYSTTHNVLLHWTSRTSSLWRAQFELMKKLPIFWSSNRFR